MNMRSYLSPVSETSTLKGIPNTAENRAAVKKLFRETCGLRIGVIRLRGRGPRKGNVGFGGQSHIALPYATSFAVYFTANHVRNFQERNTLEKSVKDFVQLMVRQGF
jgi:hypothetical protein